uniref:Uncharacterized protein n=1 Tax=viral metagenome TaxID=1070528 RepID=A0A6C0DI03_9ZZZZ
MSEIETTTKPTTEVEIPEQFTKIIHDFINDMKRTFPEYLPIINKWWKDKSNFDYIEEEDERLKTIEKYERTSTKILFSFCQKKYPPRFFEILYQNEEMFGEKSTIDTEFLPHIHFKDLWQFDISENTKTTIWKYLQLILFSIVKTVNNKEDFGDTAKLFEQIDETEFKNKLEETFSKMQEAFEASKTEGGPDNQMTLTTIEDLPNPADVHSHLNEMMNGNIGNLAKEIAEETAKDLDLDFDGITDMNDVFSKLFSSPNKLMDLIKTVGEKLDGKIKSGEMNQNDLMSEATDIMSKMKDIPGLDGIQSMLSKMGMGGMGGDSGDLGDINNMSDMFNLGKGAKINQNEMDKQMRLTQMRDRMRSKLDMKKQMKEIQDKLQETPLPSITNAAPPISDDELEALFNSVGKTLKKDDK